MTIENEILVTLKSIEQLLKAQSFHGPQVPVVTEAEWRVSATPEQRREQARKKGLERRRMKKVLSQAGGEDEHSATPKKKRRSTLC